jgi:hypothetical protein
MFELSTSPQSIIGVLRNSFKLFKHTWLKLLPMAIMVVGLTVILGMLLPKQVNVTSAYMHHISNRRLPIILGIEAVIFWLFLVMFYRCYRIMIAVDVGYNEAIKVALRKFLPCLVALFLYAIIVFFGTLCFLIPGIFLVLLLMYSAMSILIDDQGIFASFKYSAKLVWGNWWRTLAIFLIYFIVILIVILVIIFGMDLFIVRLLHVKMLNAIVLMNILGFVLILFFWISWINIFICQYYDLKLRRQLKR